MPNNRATNRRHCTRPARVQWIKTDKGELVNAAQVQSIATLKGTKPRTLQIMAHYGNGDFTALTRCLPSDAANLTMRRVERRIFRGQCVIIPRLIPGNVPAEPAPVIHDDTSPAVPKFAVYPIAETRQENATAGTDGEPRSYDDAQGRA